MPAVRAFFIRKAMLALAMVNASFEGGSRYPAFVCGAYTTLSEPSLSSQPV